MTTIKRYNLIAPENKIVVAVSGGADSVFLLWALKELRNKYSLSLHIAHLNHGIRSEAGKEAEFVRSIGKEYGIPVTVGKRDVKAYAKRNKLSLEEAGREARYSFLEEVANKIGATKIATGHTLTDEVETLFMRLARGTGRKGLSLIPPMRGKIIRPLIEIEHSEIEKFLRQKKIRYETDFSNYNCDYTRNYVRHKVIPVINEFSPSFGKKIMQLREVMEKEEEVMDEMAEATLKKMETRGKKQEARMKLDLKKFTSLGMAIKRRVVRYLLERLGNKNISFEETENIIDYITRGKVGSVLKSHNIRIIRGSKIVEFVCEHKIVPNKEKALKILPIPGEVKMGKFKICTRIKKQKPLRFDDKNKVYFDFDRVYPPLFVRARERGDIFYGQKYKKSIKRIFIDDKIPIEDRIEIPLLTDDEGILWIVGRRRAHRALVEAWTKRILEVEAKKT